MNKLLVVTGGSKGIGRAIVEKFAQAGFDVVSCARNEEELKVFQQDLASRYPSQLFYFFRTDLSKRAEVKELVKKIQDLQRPADVLVNNTGVYTPGQIHTEEEGVLENMIETNVYSAYHFTRGLIGGMIERKAGHVFTICSTASLMPYVNGGSYCISKYALLGMTKVLREEMKPYNIRVTAILPGATYTSSWAGAPFPEERFMKSEDVADALFGAYALSGASVVEELLIRPMLGDIV